MNLWRWKSIRKFIYVSRLTSSTSINEVSLYTASKLKCNGLAANTFLFHKFNRIVLLQLFESLCQLSSLIWCWSKTPVPQIGLFVKTFHERLPNHLFIIVGFLAIINDKSSGSILFWSFLPLFWFPVFQQWQVLWQYFVLVVFAIILLVILVAKVVNIWCPVF